MTWRFPILAVAALLAGGIFLWPVPCPAQVPEPPEETSPASVEPEGEDELARVETGEPGGAPAEEGPTVACGPDAPATDPAPFPVTEALRPRVEFWKSVFGRWSQREAALHDAKHPALVYEVLTLPDSMDTFSLAAREYVRLRCVALEERLRWLESRIASGEPLEDEEKSLALRITTMAGSEAILGAHARVRSQRGIREKFLQGIEASGRYVEPFRQVFRDAGLPEDLAYLPHVESSFDPRARSSAGAVGLWQFTRSAGRRFLKLTSAIDERHDPVAAAMGAARYLGHAHEQLGSWPLAVTSYNHGIEGMLRAKEMFGTDFDRILSDYDGRHFGFASKNFYAEFLAAREIATDPAAYFPEGFRPESPPEHDRLVLGKPLPPHRVAQISGVHLSELVSLNPAWSRRAIHRGLPLPAESVVWLPKGTLARFEEKGKAGRKPSGARAETAVAASADPSSLGETVVHVVRRGENLFRIAARYGVTVGDILGINALANPSFVKPGQRLRIPSRP